RTSSSWPLRWARSNSSGQRRAARSTAASGSSHLKLSLSSIGLAWRCFLAPALDVEQAERQAVGAEGHGVVQLQALRALEHAADRADALHAGAGGVVEAG